MSFYYTLIVWFRVVTKHNLGVQGELSQVHGATPSDGEALGIRYSTWEGVLSLNQCCIAIKEHGLWFQRLVSLSSLPFVLSKVECFCVFVFLYFFHDGLRHRWEQS